VNEETDEYLVTRVKDEKDNDCLKELISRHSGIYVDMIRKFGGKALTDTQSNDLMSEKDFNIYMAAMTYDSSQSKFSTYLANRTKYKCLTNKTANKKSSHIVNFDDVEYDCETPENNPCESTQDNESIKFLADIIKQIESHPDPRVATVFKQRYFSTQNHKLKPWHQIASILNLSIQGCINLHDRTIKELQKNVQYEQNPF
jgi:DNA-directed RNA polymerase specialized sigma subunit